MQSGFSLAGIAMSYQIAQKVHACTDPHDPPAFVNNRARDVVDLVDGTGIGVNGDARTVQFK